MSKTHTPAPWRVHSTTDEIGYFSDSLNNRVGVAFVNNVGDEGAQANAAHIVKCVNMFDELVAFAQEQFDEMEADSEGFDSIPLSNLKDLLARAKGGGQ